MKDFLHVFGIGLTMLCVVGICVALIFHTQDSRACRDALIITTDGSAWTVECPHEQHTLIRDADRWRCVCPNTRIEAELAE